MRWFSNRMAPGLALLPSGIFRYPENRFAGGIADQPKAFSVEVIFRFGRVLPAIAAS
jgi:hypothetical protein